MHHFYTTLILIMTPVICFMSFPLGVLAEVWYCKDGSGSSTAISFSVRFPNCLAGVSPALSGWRSKCTIKRETKVDQLTVEWGRKGKHPYSCTWERGVEAQGHTFSWVKCHPGTSWTCTLTPATPTSR